MTTVAALARDGHVAMAADSGTNVYDRPIPGGCCKIRRYELPDGTEALVGISGMGAIATVLDADLKLADLDPPKPDGLDRWAGDVARKASAICVASGVADDGKMDGLFLLGHAGRVWTVAHCYPIPHIDGIAAIGSGEGPAVGAIDTLLATCPNMPPTEIVTRAVQTAIVRDRHSDGPIQVELLPAREE